MVKLNHRNMKNVILCLLVLAVIPFSGCNDDRDEIIDQQPDQLKFYVTGYPKSVAYESNGRVEEEDEIRNLTILLMDSENNMVFQKRYYSDFYLQEEVNIPDTAYFSALSPGEYTVVIATVDVWYDSWERKLWGLESYIASNGPIFVGMKEFVLVEDQQEVTVDMEHLSAKVRVRIAENSNFDNGYVHLNFESDESVYYDIEYTDEMVITESVDRYGGSGFGVSLGEQYHWGPNGDEQTYFLDEQIVYVLPKTINSLYLDYGNYSGSVWSTQHKEIDPPVTLETGDAITFILNMDALSEDALSGIINLDDIEWNDLGEVSLP